MIPAKDLGIIIMTLPMYIGVCIILIRVIKKTQKANLNIIFLYVYIVILKS